MALLTFSDVRPEETSNPLEEIEAAQQWDAAIEQLLASAEEAGALAHTLAEPCDHPAAAEALRKAGR